jgi:cyanophycin synthetase
MAEPNAVTLTELRVLDGPNLYFTRPAIKITLGITPWLALREDRALRLSERSAETYLGSPGPPGSDRRRRFTARLAVQLTRSLADITKTKLAVRSEPAQADQIAPPMTITGPGTVPFGNGAMRIGGVSVMSRQCTGG